LLVDSLLQLPLRDFLDRVASADEPAPAGGAVAALTAAASASLLVLVARVTTRRGANTAEFDVLLARARTLQHRLSRLMESDTQAFKNLMAVRRLPHRDANETTTRRVALNQALARATHSPLEIAAACADLVVIAQRVEGLASGEIVSDARVARHLARAALLSSLDTVEQNLPHVREPEQRQEMESELQLLRLRVSS
jgi:formiminotetrahydrofolate cyclodeaminase